MPEPLLLVGAIGSPYSRKMRSILRYRRIPFQWVGHGSPVHAELPPSPLPLMPVLYYPTDSGYEATSDSTFSRASSLTSGPMFASSSIPGPTFRS